MNKKEVLEIRKQYTPERCSITRICGCYVNGNKEIVSPPKRPFCLCLMKKSSNI